ncbi:MAG TPA: CpsB/CapC family capsule biosynthesis tyrosine phosphatase [Anaerovoracaceae bacterium]|nr:CpsB/CapC family capsule biosynthesis tyrosine phosphatase [Anaerovoracaceae bacterium]
MIEIHSHILPGIDDGARDVQEAAALLALLKKQGVSSVVLTPHFYPDRQLLKDFLEQREKAFLTLSNAVEASEDRGEISGIRLVLASETLISDILLAYDRLEALCISGTEYLLLELPYAREWSGSVFRLIDRLIAKFGFTPVIAHVERYEAVRHKPEKNLDELIDLGCLLQMNIAALVDQSTRRYAMKLVKKGYIDLIGSDCHNLTTRAPRYHEFFEVVEKNRLNGYLTQWEKASKRVLSDKLP